MYQMRIKNDDNRRIMRPFEVWLYGLGFVFILVASIRLMSSLVDTIQKQKIVEERKSVQAQVRKEHEALLKQGSLVESEYFVEREAREKLGLGREGESVVIVSRMATEAGVSASPQVQIQEKKSNMRLWWELFF